jgi:hypothetical protein
MHRRRILEHSRRLLGVTLLAATALALPSCGWDGHFTVLGYTTRPNYDPSIHTVYVPIFKNKTIWRGLEFELTKAVVREIESKTPFKVESDCSKADTELIGTVVQFNKNILNVNQLNEVREVETVLGVEVIWRDRRTGEILSNPRPPGAVSPVTPPIVPLGGYSGPPPAPPPVPPLDPSVKPVLIQSTAGFVPEIGQSITTAQQQNVNRLAVQIVSMMEKPW